MIGVAKASLLGASKVRGIPEWTSFVNTGVSHTRDLVYANGQFVGCTHQIAGSSRVYTSPDGVVWTIRTPSDTNQEWVGITYGNSLYVAVGWVNISGYTRIMTSSNGISWTNRSSPALSYRAVTYGAGAFVAVGDGMATSTNGTSWTNRDISKSYLDVTVGNGRIVAIKDEIAAIHTTTTPTNTGSWASYSTGKNLNYTSVAYGNGVFVVLATGESDYPVAVSATGTTSWSTPFVGRSLGSAVTFGDGKFVTNGGYYSTNGLDWRPSTMPGEAFVRNALGYGNNMFLALGSSYNHRIESSLLDPTLPPIN